MESDPKQKTALSKQPSARLIMYNGYIGDYRVLINGSSRFVTVSSGTATITHTLNAK